MGPRMKTDCLRYSLSARFVWGKIVCNIQCSLPFSIYYCQKLSLKAGITVK